MKITTRLILAASILVPLHPAAEEMRTVPAITNPPGTLTFNAGAGSPKAWNYLGVTKEYLLDDNTAFFVTGGLGTALIGAGYIYYGNREGNGMIASTAIGIVDLQATLAYQWKVGDRDFVAAGASYGSFFMQCTCWLPVLSYEHRY